MTNRLYLSLYKKWFDEILTGKKKIEYREIKPFYDRLLSKNYTEVKFINGYGNTRPYIIVRISKIQKGGKYYEIHLGEILERGNIESPNQINQLNQ